MRRLASAEKDETKRLEGRRAIVAYLSKDMVQQSIIRVVIHDLVFEE